MDQVQRHEHLVLPVVQPADEVVIPDFLKQVSSHCFYDFPKERSAILARRGVCDIPRVGGTFRYAPRVWQPGFALEGRLLHAPREGGLGADTIDYGIDRWKREPLHFTYANSANDPSVGAVSSRMLHWILRILHGADSALVCQWPVTSFR
jgi:hypothetical protein